MRWLLIVLTFLLTGCWTGGNLYADADARPALPPGVYQMTGPDEPTKVFRVTILTSGLTQFSGPEKAEAYGFAPLDRARGTFVAWLQPERKAGSKEDQAYGLLQRKADGSFLVYVPSCKDEEAVIARKAGATVETGMFASCRFPTRAILEKAMRRVRIRDDSSTIKLAYIGK